VLVVLIFVGVLTFVSLYRDAQNRERAEGDIHDLKGKVQSSSEAQEKNTKLFLGALGQMSNEVSNLKIEVKTEELQKKLASVQADLQKTQKALAPGPKATLTFSFVPFENPPFGSGEPKAVSETALPLRPDGSVHIEWTILNLTNVEASNIDVNILICTRCKFAKEPDGVAKDPGFAHPETTRLLPVPQIEPKQFFKTISVDVIPPQFASNFTLGFSYRCKTCILEAGSLGTVHILGR
jgi:hypothetical protein